MAFPNTSISDIIATTLESRSGKIADNVTGNNALLAALKAKGKIRTFGGGREIWEEFSFADNGNVGWYSGYDTLSTAAADVLSGASFAIKQAACPVVISGLEELQNSGKEAVIDLMQSRIEVAESSMANLISAGLYSDGTGSGSKQITGLLAAVPVTPTTGTYGGINRATASNAFWRSYAVDTGAAPSATTIQGILNTAWASLVRGSDRPDLLVMDGTTWSAYLASLQALQRFTGTDTAKLGFPTIKYMDADVVMDGGIGGDATSVTCYLLNTKYLHFRPHKDRNMVPLSPNRTATNQDATVKILAWAGNLTCSGAQFQGQIKLDA
jgi:hypothetical protein